MCVAKKDFVLAVSRGDFCDIDAEHCSRYGRVAKIGTEKLLGNNHSVRINERYYTIFALLERLNLREL